MNLLRCFCLICLFFGSLTKIYSQCYREEYEVVIALARESLAERDYQLAINRLLDARDICPDERDSVNVLIKKAFEQIKGERNRADSARAEAQAKAKRNARLARAGNNAVLALQTAKSDPTAAASLAGHELPALPRGSDCLGHLRRGLLPASPRTSPAHLWTQT